MDKANFLKNNKNTRSSTLHSTQKYRKFHHNFSQTLFLAARCKNISAFDIKLVTCQWICLFDGVYNIQMSMSEQSYEQFSEDQDEQQIQRNRCKKQAFDALNDLNYNNYKHRCLLSSSYRKLNQQLSNIEQDRFNLGDNANLIDDIWKSAYFYKPYVIQDYQFKYFSSICKEAVIGGRTCKEPLIKIDHQIVHFEGKNQKIIIKDKPFLITIQSEPNSTIVYTNKPRTHPLLIFSERECGEYFIKRLVEKSTEILTPPCDLSIVVTKQGFKVESKLIYIKVISTQSQENKNRIFEMGWAIRPQQSFNYEQSGSGHLSYSSMYSQEQSQ